MKKLLIIICILSFFILACDLNNNKNKNKNNQSGLIDWKVPDGNPKTHNLGDINDFWARDLVKSTFYSLKAELLHIGEHCYIWVEKTGDTYFKPKNEVLEIVVAIGNEYDTNIYTKVMGALGVEFQFEDGNYYNTMQIADFMGNYDGKLCILLLDIKDGYVPGTGYVAGYFDSINFYSNFPGLRSNERDMIYIDTYPGIPGSQASFEVIAHEMQHLMNFVTRQVLGDINNQSSLMDIWINEGLSAAAEWAVYGHSMGRISDYNANRGGSLKNGNNFFVWDKDKDISVLDDYSTVYLFFQWLRLQNDNQIYKKIIKSNYSNFMAVTDNATGYDINNWEKLIGDWLRANFVNSSMGIYGYRGDSAFNNLTKHYINSTNTSVSLYPGEGVFSYRTGMSAAPGPSGNIRHINITSLGNNALLTFNANSSNRGWAETGTITGLIHPSQASSSIAKSFLEGIPAPYAISIEEMQRRNNE
ncbi:MAG: hypothetical protein LBU88_07890 [Treponema sp.]|nr:hypothetical protein [Treponema sp.]